VSPFAWLGPRAEHTVDALVARGVPQDALQGALRGAYWAAQRAMVPRVASGQRRGAARRLARLARIDADLTAELEQDGLSAEEAGALHVARAVVRRRARGLAEPLPAHRGRPAWRSAAEADLAALGARRSETRYLLGHVVRLVHERPLAPDEVPYVRVAFRAAPVTRAALLLRFPIPPKFGRRKNA
jgi:hypothetical protein